MRARALLGLAAAVSLAVPTAASAQPERRDADKVTGGGQIVASSDFRGAGDTVGFVATSDGGRISGEFQIVRTSTQGGSRETIYHGRVTCLEVSENQATFGGVGRRTDTGENTFFTVEVMDTGNGNQGTDTILVREDTEQQCDETDDDQFRLARGNLTVHDADN
jgi:hypothetical protein